MLRHLTLFNYRPVAHILSQTFADIEPLLLKEACSGAPRISCLEQQTANRRQVEFVFKIRALHCTPLEFRTGFLAGGLLI